MAWRSIPASASNAASADCAGLRDPPASRCFSCSRDLLFSRDRPLQVPGRVGLPLGLRSFELLGDRFLDTPCPTLSRSDPGLTPPGGLGPLLVARGWRGLRCGAALAPARSAFRAPTAFAAFPLRQVIVAKNALPHPCLLLSIELARRLRHKGAEES